MGKHVYNWLLSPVQVSGHMYGFWFSLVMQNIDHLSREEKQHFVLCACGEWMDLRDQRDVLRHHHMKKNTELELRNVFRKGDPAAFPRLKECMELN